MKQCIVVGASGYSGGVLSQLLLQHPKLKLTALGVSDGSTFSGQKLSDQFPQYAGNSLLRFSELSKLKTTKQWQDAEIFFLATPHELSAVLAAELYSSGKKIFDLSGAYRLKSAETFAEFYGFAHPHPELLPHSVYGLVEQNRHSLFNAHLVAVAGCYPTATVLGLAPFISMQSPKVKPVVHAISGVSGAGRKANLTNSFCEVSLQAYGVGSHRHKPEIEQAIEHPVIFTPHLASFNRGILATITLTLAEATSQAEVDQHLNEYYVQDPLIRVSSELPAIHHVAHTPFAQLSVRVIENGEVLQVFVAIDNLMKGAASQAIQCANLSNNWNDSLGLIANTLS